MTELTIFGLGDPVERLEHLEEPARIAAALDRIGIRYEQWPAPVALAADADQAAILDAYAPEIDRLKSACGYRAADVIRLARGAENAAALRTKFLEEHIHDEDEVRFFVEGRGAFYLRFDDRVYRVLCERGDLLGVPAGTRHWFDMGADPEFTAIRLFTNPEGWIARFTGDAVARSVPEIDG